MWSNFKFSQINLQSLKRRINNHPKNVFNKLIVWQAKQSNIGEGPIQFLTLFVSTAYYIISDKHDNKWVLSHTNPIIPSLFFFFCSKKLYLRTGK